MSVPAGIDLGRCCKEALSITNLDHFIVGDLAIRSPWNNLKQIPVRPNGGRRNMAQLEASHLALCDCIVHAVNLDVELVPFRRMRFVCFPRFVAHSISSLNIMVSRYHITEILDNHDSVVLSLWI